MSLCRPWSRVYFCPSCLRSLSSELSNAPPSHLNRTFSTATATVEKLKPTRKSKSHSNANNDETAATAAATSTVPTQEPRPQGWRTLLHSKSLGEASSVLVLRDSEAKRQRKNSPNEKPKTPQTNPSSVDPDGILSAIQKDQPNPSQSEIFESIDALRPRYKSLMPKSYEECVEALQSSFSYTQLKSYTQHRKLSGEEHAAKPPSRQPNVLVRGPWKLANEHHPLKNPSPAKPKYRSPRHRAANNLLRNAWGVEMFTENSTKGHISAFLRDPNMSLWLQVGGYNSALNRLRRKLGTSIEIGKGPRISVPAEKKPKEKDKPITIFGSRNFCNQVVEELEIILQDFYSLETNLGPLEEYGGKEISRRVRAAAENCLCTGELKSKPGDPARTKLILRGRDQSSVESCLRLLFSSTFHQKRQERVGLFIKHDAVEDFTLQALPGLNQRLERPETPINLRRSLKRLRTSETLKRDSRTTSDTNVSFWTLARDKVVSITVPNCHRLAADQLSLSQSRPKTSINHNPPSVLTTGTHGNTEHRVSLRADFGLVSFQDSRKSFEDPQMSSLFNNVRSDSMWLSPSGLMPLLLSEFKEAQEKCREVFRVKLLPAWWKMPSSQAARKFPELEINLTLDKDTQQLEIEDLRALISRKTLHMLDPSQELDMRVVRKDSTALVDLDQNEGVQAFLGRMRVTAAQHNRLSPPLYLKTKLPANLVGINSSLTSESMQEAANDAVEGEYFAEGLEHEELVTFEHEGCQLNYRRVQGGLLGGDYESVCLESPLLHDGPGDLAGAEQVSKSKITEFLRKAYTLHGKLNSSTGQQGIIAEKITQPLVRTVSE